MRKVMVKEKRMFMNFDKDMGPDVKVIRGPTFDPLRLHDLLPQHAKMDQMWDSTVTKI